MIKEYFKKILFSFFVIILSFAGLYIYIQTAWQNEKKDKGFANAIPTSSNKFVCEANNFECVKNLMVDLNGSKQNTLLFGNSQLGAINQFSTGEINYAQQLSEESNQKIDLPLTIRSIWIPNATLSEFKEIFLSMKKCSTRIDNLIIPIFLDDMGEQKIRDSLKNYSTNICSDFSDLSQYKNAIKTNLHNMSNSDKLDKTILQNTIVLKDIQSINTHFRIFLYSLRNSIFGITASSKRKIVPTAYRQNLQSLKSIINSRQSLGMPTIIYIPPLLHISSGNEIPYLKNDYSNFKNDMKNICDKKQCIYFDLDSIIPDEKWGYKASTSLKGEQNEIDFMHFTYEGHQIMSKAFINILNNHIK